MARRPKIIGQLLLDRGVIDEAALADALDRQPDTCLRLGEVLVGSRALDEEDVAAALAAQLGLEHVPGPLKPTREALRWVHPGLARARSVVPLSLSHRTLRLAMADPLDLEAVDDLRFQTGRRVEAVVSSPSAVRDALARHYQASIDTLVEPTR